MAVNAFSNPQFGVDTSGSIKASLNGANALTPKAAVQAKTQTSKKLYKYPSSMLIDANTDYLQIKVLQFKAPGFSLDRFTQAPVNFNLTEISSVNKTLLNTIILPMPASIMDSNSVQWGEGTLGPVEGFGVASGQDIIKKGISGIVEAFQSASTAGGSLIQDANAQKSLQQYFAGAAVEAAGGNVSGLGILTRATGAVLNNNQELLFQGPSLRSFSFSFDFSPRDANEAENVRQIIRILKKSMSAKRNGPTSVQGLFIGSPEVFELSYRTGQNEHKFLNRFKQCALTDMQVNYNASGSYATYYDGTPVHMQMSLTFQELNPIYAEDYDRDKGRDGVGY